MANILNKKKINFPWKLRVFFYQKTGKNLCIHLVPKAITSVIRLYHDEAVHCGTEKTLQGIRAFYWWIN